MIFKTAKWDFESWMRLSELFFHFYEACESIQGCDGIHSFLHSRFFFNHATVEVGVNDLNSRGFFILFSSFEKTLIESDKRADNRHCQPKTNTPGHTIRILIRKVEGTFCSSHFSNLISGRSVLKVASRWFCFFEEEKNLTGSAFHSAFWSFEDDFRIVI